MSRLNFMAIFGLIFSSALLSGDADACIGGIAEFGNATLTSSGASVNGKAVAYPTITPDMRNKTLDLPLIKQKGLEVQIVYVKSTKKNDDVVATYYRVVQEGYPPTVVRVNSNVNELGMRFRSIVIPPEGEDPPPAIDQTYGCGGGHSTGRSNGTSN